MIERPGLSAALSIFFAPALPLPNIRKKLAKREDAPDRANVPWLPGPSRGFCESVPNALELRRAAMHLGVRNRHEKQGLLGRSDDVTLEEAPISVRQCMWRQEGYARPQAW